MPGTLYVVATPIGNLEDVTFRSINILKSVNLILSEDTRKTSILLKHYEISTPTMSYHQQSAFSKKQEILNMLLQGKNIALVTDAGTPGISDPGNELVDYILQNAIVQIIPIPGSSSITSALSVCGFNVNNFLFLGFWPKKKTKKLFEKIKDLDCPAVFFDSPYRIKKNLEAIKENLGDKRIFVGQELTKLHERSLRGTLSDVLSELEKEQKELGRVKGELVCILEL